MFECGVGMVGGASVRKCYHLVSFTRLRPRRSEKLCDRAVPENQRLPRSSNAAGSLLQNFHGRVSPRTLRSPRSEHFTNVSAREPCSRVGPKLLRSRRPEYLTVASALNRVENAAATHVRKHFGAVGPKLGGCVDRKTLLSHWFANFSVVSLRNLSALLVGPSDIFSHVGRKAWWSCALYVNPDLMRPRRSSRVA